MVRSVAGSHTGNLPHHTVTRAMLGTSRPSPWGPGVEVLVPETSALRLHGAGQRNMRTGPAMGYRCVCTTGAVQHKAEVQSKSQRGKLFSDMS